jgi:lipopolysaccharide transport system ATP-binding protein
MGDWAIRVEGLSKKYRLSHRKGNSDDTLVKAFAGGIRNLLSFSGQEKHSEDFWALRDIDFTINRGDRVGIIGRNGAGKSTLLKIMSRVVKPTTGRIEYRGRMASLLEVGTGFHGELTGRENIYLNGTILGMDRREIDKKFDAIVAFSEIEQFLDTPVKRYSSGMYVRLAFAVAAHLEPEILIVDEVLAVGDSVFQKKCIDKMTDIASQGRTILFVSHSFQSIKALCDKAILLEKGKLTSTGSIEEVLAQYSRTEKVQGHTFDLASLSRDEHERGLIFSEISFSALPVPFGERISFCIRLKTNNRTKKYGELDFGVNFCDEHYNTVYHCSNRFIGVELDHHNDDDAYCFEIENNLKPGTYSLVLFLRSNDVIQDFLINRVSIEVADGNPYGFNDTAQIQGAVLPVFTITRK